MYPGYFVCVPYRVNSDKDPSTVDSHRGGRYRVEYTFILLHLYIRLLVYKSFPVGFTLHPSSRRPIPKFLTDIRALRGPV